MYKSKNKNLLFVQQRASQDIFMTSTAKWSRKYKAQRNNIKNGETEKLKHENDFKKPNAKRHISKEQPKL